MRATVGLSVAAAWAAQPMMLAWLMASPKMSCIKALVRAVGTRWCWFKCTTSALARGPYCTGALMPTGHWPLWVCPQAQVLRSSWCSMICMRIFLFATHLA